MTTQAQFWNKLATKYAKQPVGNVAAWDETLARTRAYLEPDYTVLEIGAVTGSSALRLHDAVQSYRATDYSDKMIGFAQEKLEQEEAANLSFAVAEIAEEPSQTYDAVIAFNLLHLVPELPKFLGEVERVLKPGGVFVSKSGCIAGKYSLFKPAIWLMQRFGKAPYVQFFSAQALEQQMENASLQVVESESLPKKSINQFVVAKKSV